MSAAISIRRIGPKMATSHLKHKPVSDKQREIHRAYCDGEAAEKLAKRLGLNRHTVWEAISRVHHANKDERLAKVARGELP